MIAMAAQVMPARREQAAEGAGHPRGGRLRRLRHGRAVTPCPAPHSAETPCWRLGHAYCNKASLSLESCGITVRKQNASKARTASAYPAHQGPPTAWGTARLLRTPSAQSRAVAM